MYMFLLSFCVHPAPFTPSNADEFLLKSLWANCFRIVNQGGTTRGRKTNNNNITGHGNKVLARKKSITNDVRPFFE